MTALSNRQRRLQRKAAPKPARVKAAPVIETPPQEPRGLAVAAAVRAQVQARIKNQIAPDLALGTMTEAQAKAALKVEACQVGGVVFYDPQKGTIRPATAIRAPGDDGILALQASGALTPQLVKAALAFRLCYETANRSLGSCLGSAGEGRRAHDWSKLQLAIDKENGALVRACSAIELLHSYVMARLGQLERAVRDASVDGRELSALQLIAGEGRSVRQAAGAGGKTAMLWRDALIRALEAISPVLRIGEQ